MRDEEYEFFQDCREKKSTAASAFKRRTHTGKGGRVRFPSDYLSIKEFKKMNGETKSYRLNEPMSWDEFKAMPDDLKVMYLNLLIQKYNPSARDIGTMFGVCGQSVINYGKKIGVVFPLRNPTTPWDKEGWLAWVNGVPKATKEEPETVVAEIVQETAEEVPAEEPMAEEVIEPVTEIPCGHGVDIPVRKRAIPSVGNMVFEGLAEDVLETVRMLLGGAKVHISITWDVLDEV